MHDGIRRQASDPATCKEKLKMCRAAKVGVGAKRAGFESCVAESEAIRPGAYPLAKIAEEEAMATNAQSCIVPQPCTESKRMEADSGKATIVE